MKGYKALDMDMRATMGDKMQYELGKWYETKETIVPCKSGFHFCKTIEDVNDYYELCTSRLFEVEATGDIIEADENKMVCSNIRLLREISQEEIKSYLEKMYCKKEEWNLQKKKLFISYGINLDEFVKDEDWYVREAVAKHGRPQDLDILVRDKDYDVRAAVAKHGRPQDLDILVKDRSWHVREAVARYGRPQDLDILVRDEDYDVRVAVAKQGRPQDLDILVKDKSWHVRKTVAKHFEFWICLKFFFISSISNIKKNFVPKYKKKS